MLSTQKSVRWSAKDALNNPFQVYQVDKTNVMYLQLGDGTPQPVFIPRQLLAAEAPTEDAGSTEDASSMWQAARCDERSTQVPIAGILAAHTS